MVNKVLKELEVNGKCLDYEKLQIDLDEYKNFINKLQEDKGYIKGAIFVKRGQQILMVDPSYTRLTLSGLMYLDKNEIYHSKKIDLIIQSLNKLHEEKKFPTKEELEISIEEFNYILEIMDDSCLVKGIKFIRGGGGNKIQCSFYDNVEITSLGKSFINK